MTVESYGEAVTQLATFLDASGRSDAIEDIDRAAVEDIDRTAVEGFIGDQLARREPATAAVRYRSLEAFFRWAGASPVASDERAARRRPVGTEHTPSRPW